LKTFNSGIGMILVVAADRAADLAALLTDKGETVHRIGHVTGGQGVAYTGSIL
jgi:phosphoribosylformylglycinamidine cyclo-ligase